MLLTGRPMVAAHGDARHRRGPQHRRLEAGHQREAGDEHPDGDDSRAKPDAPEERSGQGEHEGHVLARHGEQVGEPAARKATRPQRLVPVIAEHEAGEQRNAWSAEGKRLVFELPAPRLAGRPGRCLRRCARPTCLERPTTWSTRNHLVRRWGRTHPARMVIVSPPGRPRSPRRPSPTPGLRVVGPAIDDARMPENVGDRSEMRLTTPRTGPVRIVPHRLSRQGHDARRAPRQQQPRSSHQSEGSAHREADQVGNGLATLAPTTTATAEPTQPTSPTTGVGQERPAERTSLDSRTLRRAVAASHHHARARRSARSIE